MRFGKTLSAVLLIAALALSACQKQEGPAERAGKEVDKVVDKAGQQLEKAGSTLQDASKRERKQ